MSLGQSSSFTGLNITDSYNSRFQPQEFKASSPGGNAIDISYNFVDPTTQKNAGHVYSIINNLNSSRSQTFTYDQLNRITSAGTSATTGTYCWGYQYSYDAWGNLTSQAGWSPTYNACTQTVLPSVSVDGNNHISNLGFAYDPTGNATTDGIYSYAWDGESQLKSAAGVNYLYDGDGRRVAKVGSKLYWYGAGGQVLAETDTSGNSTAEYIYFDGKRIARIADGVLPVQNASFETYNPLTISCGTNCAFNNGPIPGWSGTGGSVEYNSTYYNLPLPNGNIVAWSNGGTISQTTGTPVQPNSTYTLSVYVGHLLNGYATTYSISLEAGSTVLATLNGSNSAFPLGEFVQQTLSYTSGASVPSGDLTIVLACTAAQCDFDAVQLNGNVVSYYVEDSLGSSRIVTSASGAVLDDSDFYPYGGERPYLSSSGNVYKFEGKERDTETQNDDFGARYYSNRFGRWLSADWSSVPIAVPYANLSNPQTLNLYSMVADDPESFEDLDGHLLMSPEDLGDCNPGGCNSGDSSVLKTINDTAAGAVSAWARDNGSSGLDEQGNDVGRALGHIAATVQGLAEVVEGGTLAVTGTLEAVVASPTVVGSAPGVAATAVGTLEVAHGSAVLKNALQNASNEQATGSKSTTPTGKSSSGQNINAYGEKLGPTNEPQRHGADFSTRKAAKDAARKAGKRSPNQDKGHFHAVDKDGKRIPNSGHYNFPE